MSELLAELRHPLRRRLLRLTLGADDPISPTDLARQVEVTLSTVAYHVRVLATCGAFELVETRQSRGSVQHFYRVAVKPERAHEALRLAEGPEEEPAGEEIS